MKRFIFFAIILSSLALSSCRNADELPPVNKGYASTYIMPDPVNLTAEDRAYLEELEKEYNAATGN